MWKGNSYRFFLLISKQDTQYGKNGEFSALIDKPLQNLHICIVMKHYTIITERREIILRKIILMLIGKD